MTDTLTLGDLHRAAADLCDAVPTANLYITTSSDLPTISVQISRTNGDRRLEAFDNVLQALDYTGPVEMEHGYGYPEVRGVAWHGVLVDVYVPGVKVLTDQPQEQSEPAPVTRMWRGENVELEGLSL